MLYAPSAATLALILLTFTSGCVTPEDQPPVTEVPTPLEQRAFSLESIGFGTLNATALSQEPRPLLTIQVHSSDSNFNHIHTPATLNSRLFTNSDSINAYFLAVSEQFFTWSNAGILGPLEINFSENPTQTLILAIRAADNAGFDFSAFDKNHDHIVDPSELAVLAIDNFSTSGGAARYIPCIPTRNHIQYCGLAAISGTSADLATVAHELAHLLGAIDWYGSNCLSPYATLMSCGYRAEIPFLDPWHRMRLGWVESRIQSINGHQYAQIIPVEPFYPAPEEENAEGHEEIGSEDEEDLLGRVFGIPVLNPELPLTPAPTQQYGCERLDPATQSGSRPLILTSTAMGPREYFMLEARGQSPTSAAQDHLTQGVYVWQVRTDDYNRTYNIQSLTHPNGMDMTGFLVGPNGARGSNRPRTPAEGLIDLRWMDGRSSGIEIKVSPITMDSFYWVQWQTQGTEIPVRLDAFKIEGNEIVLTGDFPMIDPEFNLSGQGWRLKNRYGFIIPEVTLSTCKEVRLQIPFGLTPQTVQDFELHWKNQKILNQLH